VADLVVLQVVDEAEAARRIHELEVSEIETEYSSGRVWRLSHRLTVAEITQRLHRLPCVFPELGIYFKFESLRAARESHAFEFLLLEYRATKSLPASVKRTWNADQLGALSEQATA
jgi:hypothetical protein